MAQPAVPVPRQPHTRDELATLLRRQTVLAAMMAVRQLETIEGALSMRRAELDGLCRLPVIRACESRIEELGGREAYKPIELVLGAKAIDPDMRKWEKEKGKEA